MAESEGGLGRCKKFGGAGVQAKRGSANVDVEVEVKFWFHCAIVSSPSKEEGKVSRSRPSPENRQFWRPLVKRLLAVRACCEKFLGRSMRNDGCALATSADTVKASFSQSLGPSQGDVQVSSTTIYTATWLENGNSNTGRLKQRSALEHSNSNKETRRLARANVFRICSDSQLHHDQTRQRVLVALPFPPCFVIFFDPQNYSAQAFCAASVVST